MVVTVTRPARAGEWSRIKSLLTTEGLPTSDLDPQSTADFIVAVGGGAVVGAIAVERYGDQGLLRSLVVDNAWRGRGLGKELVAAAESASTNGRLSSLTLLTQTADRFFQALGYREIRRDDAPTAIKASVEFS